MSTLASNDSVCPELALLGRITNRWSLLALTLLVERPHRFNELRRALGGISQKVLSQTLKGLERDGLLNRKVTPSVPVTVEYSVTGMGLTLHDSVTALRTWSDANFSNVLLARERFDQAHAWVGTPPNDLFRASA